ncbi:MAG: hypothetical protein KGY76_02045 [Candidatus Thermoplasmatota archaeon]|nr:hypothetical protein [Candidatus Thermoplasmatota archaeon]
MKKSGWFALIAILSFSILIRTIPLYDFTLWGMDCGEYLYYTHRLVENGRIYGSIDGWGTAYPFFPGMFILGGSFHLLTGTDLIISTTFIPVLISGFSPLFVFLIVHKLMDDWRPAILSTFFFAALPPIIYSYSQPRPETIGFFLMALILALNVTLLKEHKKKVAGLMVFSVISLVVTHHLSMYFFLLMLLGGLFVSRLWRNREWELDKDRTILYILFTLMTLIYWVYFAGPFGGNRLEGALVFPSYSILAVPFLVLIVIELLVRVRRNHEFYVPINFHKQDYRSFLRFVAIMAIIVVPIFIHIAFTGMPVKDIRLGTALFFYSPIIALSAFGVPTRKVIKALQEGPSIIGWLAFILISLGIGALFNSNSLLGIRHATFLLFVVSIFFGIGLFYFLMMFNPADEKIKTVALSLAIFLLVASVVPASFPSQERAGGYTEGVESEDMETVFWLKSSTTGKIGTDHRMSAAAFSVGNKNLTWTEGEEMYFSSNLSIALLDLKENNVSYIAWDEEMLEGTATDPGQNPKPLNQDLKDGYEENLYRVYGSEECDVYLTRGTLSDRKF